MKKYDDKALHYFSMALSTWSFYALGKMIEPIYGLYDAIPYIAVGMAWSFLLTMNGMKRYGESGNIQGIYRLGLIVALPWGMLTPFVYEKAITLTIDKNYPRLLEDYETTPKFNPKKLKELKEESDKIVLKNKQYFKDAKVNYNNYINNQDLEKNKLINKYKKLREEREEMKSYRDKAKSEYSLAYNFCKKKEYDIDSYEDIAICKYETNLQELKQILNNKKKDASEEYPIISINGLKYSKKIYPLIIQNSEQNNNKLLTEKKAKLEEIEKQFIPMWVIGGLVYLFGFIFETRISNMSAFVRYDELKGKTKNIVHTTETVIEATERNREAVKENLQIVHKKIVTDFHAILAKKSDIEKYLLSLDFIPKTYDKRSRERKPLINNQINDFVSVLVAIVKIRPKGLGVGEGLSKEDIQKNSVFSNPNTGKKRNTQRHQMRVRNMLISNGVNGANFTQDEVTKVFKKFLKSV